MFSGIVQNRGCVALKEKRGRGVHFRIRFEKPEKGLSLGESVAVNGVCLTVAGKQGRSFSVEVVRETLKATTLGFLKPREQVHLERALQYGDAIGGHFVSGHVDARGRVVSVKNDGQDKVMVIRAPKKVIRLLAVKGSVAVNGVSLTIQTLRDSRFEVVLIPHTLKETLLGDLCTGQQVNLEADMLARYAGQPGSVTRSRNRHARPETLRLLWLQRQGF